MQCKSKFLRSAFGIFIGIAITFPLLTGLVFSQALAQGSVPDWGAVIEENQSSASLDMKSYLYLAIAYANTGKLAKAKEAFQSIAKAGYVEFGREVIEENEAKLKRNPGDIVALNCLAFTYYAFERYEAALSEFLKIVALDRGNVWVRQYLALVYGKLGLLDKGIEVLKKAIEIDPRNEYSHLLLGLAYQERKWYLLAMIEFAKAPNAIREVSRLRD